MLHIFSLPTTVGAVIPNVVLVLFFLFRFRAHDNSNATNGAKELQIESTSVAIFKGGPEPLEKEIHKILGSKREDRFSDPFLKLVQKNSGSLFRTCFITVIYVRTLGHCESSRRSARR